MFQRKHAFYGLLTCLFALALLAGCSGLPGLPGGSAEPTSNNLIEPVASTPGLDPTQQQQAAIETAIANLKSQTPPAVETAAPIEATPTPPPIPPAESATPEPTQSAVPAAAPTSAAVATQPGSAVSQLALLKDRDIWLLDDPGGKPYQLTVAGDILSFAWAPDGQRIAAYNGKTICFVQRDGSVRSACLDLGLDDTQAKIERRIVWSPDQRWIVLWNPINPWDEGAIGWLVVALDGSNTTYRIQDPVDWGASLAPNNEAGGITGEPLFLPDGRLVGTLTHRILCSSGGCHYQLFQFDLDKRTFSLFPNKPEEGWSEGLRLLLSPDRQHLINYGVFLFGCDSYITFADSYDLNSQTRKTYNLEQQAVADLSPAPAASQSVIARTAGCASQDQNLWSQTCGLSQGFEVFPMQLWDMETGSFRDLPPGLMPTWSPDGQVVAFRSCLAQKEGTWQADPSTPASIYLWHPGDNTVTPVEAGTMPQWQP